MAVISPSLGTCYCVCVCVFVKLPCSPIHILYLTHLCLIIHTVTGVSIELDAINVFSLLELGKVPCFHWENGVQEVHEQVSGHVRRLTLTHVYTHTHTCFVFLHV